MTTTPHCCKRLEKTKETARRPVFIRFYGAKGAVLTKGICGFKPRPMKCFSSAFPIAVDSLQYISLETLWFLSPSVRLGLFHIFHLSAEHSELMECSYKKHLMSCFWWFPFLCQLWVIFRWLICLFITGQFPCCSAHLRILDGMAGVNVTLFHCWIFLCFL